MSDNPFTLGPVQQAETIALDRLRVQVNNYVSRHAVLQVTPDHLLDGFHVRLQSEVLARSLDSHETTEYAHFEEPASPWQMFKRDHATSWWLGWLVERRPVRTVTRSRAVTFTCEALDIYPDARIALPEDFGAPIMVRRVTGAPE